MHVDQSVTFLHHLMQGPEYEMLRDVLAEHALLCPVIRQVAQPKCKTAAAAMLPLCTLA